MRKTGDLALAGCLVLLAACGGGDGPFDIEDVAIDVTVADFNGDGYADVALPIIQGKDKPGSVALFLHQASAGRGYQPRVDYPTSQGADTIAAGDLDLDGLPDVVAAADTAGSNNVFVLRNRVGSPGVLDSPRLLSAEFPNGIAIADINGDGRPDLLIAASRLMLSLQQPGMPGSFAAPTVIDSGPGAVLQAAVGDLNGDGLRDIAIVNDTSASVLLQAAADPPQFGGALQLAAGSAGDRLAAIAVADLDGDGRDDIVICDGTRGELLVLLQSRAQGGLFPAVTRFGGLAVGQAEAMAVADINGDGHPDVVVGGSSGVQAFLQDTASPGSYIASGFYAAPAATGVAIADLDADGRMDIVIPAGPCTSSTDSCKHATPGVLYQNPANPGHFLAVQSLL